MSIDKISGKLVKHKHKGADISDITNYIGQPLGVFITSYPSTPSVGRYDFAGTDGAVISGETYNNGDSAFWDGSAWTRIPAKAFSQLENDIYYKNIDCPLRRSYDPEAVESSAFISRLLLSKFLEARLWNFSTVRP